MRATSEVRSKESGVASLFLVIVLMTVLGLISIGFSRLVNREVRQSLDRELSLTASYAAESGIWDARAYLADNPTQAIPGCKTPNDPHFVDNGDISGDGQAKYTCVIVNPKPQQLFFSIKPGESKVVRLTGNSLNSLSRIYFSWQNSNISINGPKALSGTLGEMPQQPNVDQDMTGLLRLGIYPMTNDCYGAQDSHGDRLSRYSAVADSKNALLECASRNYFMYPIDGAGGPPDCNYSNINNSNGCVRYIGRPPMALPNSARDDGAVVPSNCNNSATHKPNTSFGAQAKATYCNAVVSDLPAVGANPSAYYLRLTAIYNQIDVWIQATDNSATPNTLDISNAQAVVDVTGSGNDVLKRIQTYSPLQQTTPFVKYGLQSMESVCKLFRNEVVQPGIYERAKLDPTAGPGGEFNTDSSCSFPSGGSAIDNSGVPPIDNEPPPTASISADDTNINNGQSTNLHWDSVGASTCIGNGFNTGNATRGGPLDTGPLSTGDHTYSITCFGPFGTSPPASVTIHVSNPPPSPNIDYFTANGSADSTTINQGESATLSWSASNATYCDTSFAGQQGASGTIGVSPSSGTVYYINCYGAGGGPATAQVIVNVNTGGGGGGGGGSAPSCTTPTLSGSSSTSGTFRGNATCTGATSASWTWSYSTFAPDGSFCSSDSGSGDNFTILGGPYAGRIEWSFSLSASNSSGSTTVNSPTGSNSHSGGPLFC
jgi:Tfp pilus assembly protein PilX